MSARAGWYPDPTAPGMVRWWNGTGWEDMTMPESLAPAPSTLDKAVAIGEFLSKAWFLLLFMGFLVLLIWIIV